MATHRCPSTRRDPSSSSMRTSSSTKSGFPSAALITRWRQGSSAAPPLSTPRRLSIRVSACSSPRGLSSIVVAFGVLLPHPGRISPMSGRARQRSRSGASRVQPSRYSMRSRSVSSAQWMSSMTTTSGWSACRSITRRIAQEVSSGSDGASVKPSRPTMRSLISSASPSRPTSTPARRPMRSTIICGSSVSVTPASVFITCTTGQYVIPSP